MVGGNLSSDQVIEKLVEMGFDNCVVVQAVQEVGPSLDNAIDFILNNSSANRGNSGCSTSSTAALSKRSISSNPQVRPLRQSSILDQFSRSKRSRTVSAPDVPVNEQKETFRGVEFSDFSNLKTVRGEDVDIQSDWETEANSLLQKNFGYASLKSFQKEALAAWISHQDCLVLAATGSGKSLCFQIPALLTRKVVVVISPLISLMHDQCLKLSKHGVSACFLGSGQPDSSVEKKAMRGMYDIIYVCPETVLRLIKPLQKLAEIRGIALFAIDEVHCVSKWGHDFRPDYRQLSVLRQNFNACNLKFLKYDIPLMALTATATKLVREDVIQSLKMSKETKIVLTSFFRPNLRFLVKHSRTSSPSSYQKDFCQLVDKYARKRNIDDPKGTMTSKAFHDCSDNSTYSSISKADKFSAEDVESSEDDCSDIDNSASKPMEENGSTARKGKELSIEYLENDVDVFHGVDDWDVAFGEFCGQSPCEDWNIHGLSTSDLPNKLEERVNLLQKPLEEGLTIIYVPTRKETLIIAKYLCSFGVKAAAYNASLPKSHLRQVHKEFHEDRLEVVVATIAFGMGIDKSNVRRIIHYGWPQSLEAYYQEAGRAGRDGKLAECILYANLSQVPTLLPNKRSEDQKKQAYKMLSDCFKYGMNTSCCRAKLLVEYFGEDFSYEKCLLCDVCVEGPPKMENLKQEAVILMQVLAACHQQMHPLEDSYEDNFLNCQPQELIRKPNLRTCVSKIMEQSERFSVKDHLWWRGFARIMESKGLIRESDDKVHVQIKFPEPTKLGMEFLQFEGDQPFNCYPEADMLVSLSREKSYSGFIFCGKGWADPQIRRERLERIRSNRKQRQTRSRKSRKFKPDFGTAKGRIAAKLMKLK